MRPRANENLWIDNGRRKSRCRSVGRPPCARSSERTAPQIHADEDAHWYHEARSRTYRDRRPPGQLRASAGRCVYLDALEGALNAVDQGYATALVDYSWNKFGTTEVDVLLDKIRNGQDPKNSVYSELFIVDKTKIADYIKKQKDTAAAFKPASSLDGQHDARGQVPPSRHRDIPRASTAMNGYGKQE